MEVVVCGLRHRLLLSLRPSYKNGYSRIQVQLFPPADSGVYSYFHRVYRHKGYYHVHYNHFDSYPEGWTFAVYISRLEAHSFVQGLGVQVAAEVPRDPEAYKAWLERLRKSLDADFEENKSQIDSLAMDYFITKEQADFENDIMIEWVYEIDLDHEVFLGRCLAFVF